MNVMLILFLSTFRSTTKKLPQGSSMDLMETLRIFFYFYACSTPGDRSTPRCWRNV